MNPFSMIKSQTTKILPQRRSSNVARDGSRTAKFPGKRISASGKVYWETRKNRSDVVRSGL